MRDDSIWRELGIAAPARRALVALKIYSVKDLARVTETTLTSAHGMGPSALAVLKGAMKRERITFRK